MDKARFAHRLRVREGKSARRRARKAAAAATALVAGATGAADVGTAQAAFPGREGLIAYDSVGTNSPTGDFDVWKIDPNAATPPTTQTDLTNNPAEDVEPNWSPDGQSIGFASGGRSATSTLLQVWTMDQNGGSLVQHTTDTTPPGINNTKIAYSPDGQFAAFSSGVSAGGGRTGGGVVGDIWVVNLSTGALVQVTNNPADDANPNWSPDGNYIVFESNRSGVYHIYRVNAPTAANPNPAPESGLVDLTPSDTSNDTQANYSPGGTWILFSSDRDNPIDGNVWIKRADTSTNEYELTTAGGHAPVFAPDGRKFAFSSYRAPGSPGVGDIWTQNLLPDTSSYANPVDITQSPNADDEHPDWQPIPASTCQSQQGGGSGGSGGSGGGGWTIPPLPIDPGYPMNGAMVNSGTGAHDGPMDNDAQGGGSSDAGMGAHPGDSSQTGGQMCPGGGGGSSDHAQYAGYGSSH
ncbi:MAG: PD40 domain-containing protein [Actinobacteria bacterium]|nr:PD40 domain-containing protein [Actinomycetota bacterium]